MKRRTHQGASSPTISTCKETGETHLRHRAYQVGDDLYYRGKVLVSGQTED